MYTCVMYVCCLHRWFVYTCVYGVYRCQSIWMCVYVYLWCMCVVSVCMCGLCILCGINRCCSVCMCTWGCMCVHMHCVSVCTSGLYILVCGVYSCCSTRMHVCMCTLGRPLLPILPMSSLPSDCCPGFPVNQAGCFMVCRKCLTQQAEAAVHG